MRSIKVPAVLVVDLVASHVQTTGMTNELRCRSFADHRVIKPMVRCRDTAGPVSIKVTLRSIQVPGGLLLHAYIPC